MFIIRVDVIFAVMQRVPLNRQEMVLVDAGMVVGSAYVVMLAVT